MSEQEQTRLEALRALGLLDTPPEERFDRLTRLAHLVFDVPMAYISLIDDQRQWFKSEIGLGVQECPRTISICNYTLVGDKLLILEDAAKHPLFKDNPFVANPPHIRFYAGYPLHTKEGIPVGTFCLCDIQPRPLSTQQMTIFQEFGALAEREIQVTEALEIDDLTGLYNRKGFLNNAQRMLEWCERNHQIASLIFMDLDHFKQVNDQFGHPAGDALLTHFGRVLSRHIRTSDIAARLYGDEFVIFSMGTSARQAEHLIQRIREHLANTPCPETPGSGVPLTFSAGIAEYTGHQDVSLFALIETADHAMYQNKRSRQTKV